MRFFFEIFFGWLCFFDDIFYMVHPLILIHPKPNNTTHLNTLFFVFLFFCRFVKVTDTYPEPTNTTHPHSHTGTAA